MKDLAHRFPEGIDVSRPLDMTRFVKVSIHEVIQMLREAMAAGVPRRVGVSADRRATLIPLLAVPVSLVGTFAGMYAFGFCINR